MRIHLGNVPELADFQPEAEGLQDIRGLKANLANWLAALAGFVLLIFPILGVCLLFSYVAIPASEMPATPSPPAPLGAVFLALLTFIPLHELCHLVWHPKFGTSDRSILVIWPSRVRFGVYFEGSMSRTRWVAMRIAPLVILSILPSALLAIFQNVPFDFTARTFFEVVLVVNGVGSGGDVIAIIWVLNQVPRSARMVFRGGKAYWKPGEDSDRDLSLAGSG